MTSSDRNSQSRGDLAARRREAQRRAAARAAGEATTTTSGTEPGGTHITRRKRGEARPEGERTGRGAAKTAPKKKGRFWWTKWALLVVACVMVATSAFAWTTVSNLQKGLPDLGNLNQVATFQTTRIYDAKKRPLTTLTGEGNRVIIHERLIPKHLKQAVISIEDKRFYEHPAVDYWGIVRAAYINVIRRSVVQGGSSITQQYVKNAYFSPRRTMERKVKEVLLAYRLEKEYTKDQILARYLNTIYFGEGAYGVEAAAQTYFNRHARDLDLAQSAMLAALIRSPARYSPFNHPDKAKERRKLVLDQMVAAGHITQEEADAAADAPLPKTKTAVQRSGIAPYFVDHVTQKLVEMVGEQAAYSGGLRVYTTLDTDLQRMGEEAVKAELDEPSDPSASLVALDPNTGAVKVMVGGRDYKTQQYNVATQGHRQAGSAFKTFVLAAAIDSGLSPDQYFDSDSPASFEVTGAADWKVSNYEGSGDGYISLTDATERSVNVAYANVMMKVGVDRVIQTAKAMGITAPLNRDPAIALGGLREGVNTLEMASAYGTLATGGMRATPYTIERIVDAEGKPVPMKRPAKRRALLQAVAALVTDTLEGVIDSGTGTRADISRPQAGKTGTAQNYVDAWFVGYVPQMSAAVWVGHPKSQVPMRDVHGMRVTGGSFPARIWARFMEKALEGSKKLDFPEPPDGSIVYEQIDPVTGYLASEYCPRTTQARYAKGKAPKSRCPVHEQLLVPNVEGMTLEKAQDTLKDAGLESSATVVPSGSPKGQVVDQDPEAGAKAKRGLVVKLKVSDGKGGTTPSDTPTAVAVPRVNGLTLSAAEAALSKLGLKWSVTYVKSGKPRDTVIGSDPPAGTTVKPGATVLLMVSGAGGVATVPSIVGLSQAAATSRLEGAGFDVVVETASKQESKGKTKGTVVRQSPSAGATAPQGSSVVIYIARP